MNDIALREPTSLDRQPHPPAASDPTGGRLVAWARAAASANQLAGALVQTAFVPAHFRGNTGDATAAILWGDELGLSPIAALKNIYVVHGTPALYTRGMVALAQAQGHEIWTAVSTPEKVVVKGKRRGSEQVETAEWTIARAQQAGYTNNKKYATNPQEMLYAKAAAEVTRKIAADALAGVPHSVEDLELGEASESEPVKVTRRRKAPEPEAPQPVEAPDPDRVTDAQVQKIAILANELDLTRDQKIAGVSSVVGRQVESTKDLSKSEASAVIESMTARRAQSTVEEVLDGELVDP